MRQASPESETVGWLDNIARPGLEGSYVHPYSRPAPAFLHVVLLLRRCSRSRLGGWRGRL